MGGYYCPAGSDCSNDSSLCVKGACEATPEEPCENGISCVLMCDS